MTIIETLITDRSQSDLDFLQSLHATPMEQWGGGPPAGEAVAGEAVVGEGWQEWYYRAVSRGAYNYTDLNRVGEALRYLSDTLAGYGYNVPVTARTDWTRDAQPTAVDFDAYLADVAAVRAVLELFETTPEVPESISLTLEQANDIEKILVDVDTVINRIVASFARSGAFTFWSGNRPLPCAKSDLGRTWAELDAMGTGWRSWQTATWYLLLYGNLKAEGDVA